MFIRKKAMYPQGILDVFQSIYQSSQKQVRVRGYNIKTEKSYLYWIRYFIRFNNLKYPDYVLVQIHRAKMHSVDSLNRQD
ncbi:phage integrase N-terminal SAM-like domain-containing protein [Vibrio zhugei]|uniref:Phage integrase N-terminal SAM-like domain-containing protein n=1 Tax=Vibrio zhugei TaxID=2479546 RepID=A0ABV7CAV6_9VIBR